VPGGCALRACRRFQCSNGRLAPTPNLSRAVIYEKFGGPEVLELREVPEPRAGTGEVRVRVAAIGLNPMDAGIASMPELAAMFGVSFPAGFGYDFAGVIDEIGDGVDGVAMGDRIFGGGMAKCSPS
jgi:NADPH:quinone reductase-like Zn-dependent oxidoreductase